MNGKTDYGKELFSENEGGSFYFDARPADERLKKERKKSCFHVFLLETMPFMMDINRLMNFNINNWR